MLRTLVSGLAVLAGGVAFALVPGRALAQGEDPGLGPPVSVASFGPVHMTADQDLLLAAFVPPPTPPGLAEAVGPPCLVFRVFDDTGALLFEQVTEGVAPGTGAALAAKGTDLFQSTDPPYITAEINLETSPPVLPEDPLAVAGGWIPPFLPTLQLLDGATGHVDLALPLRPTWDPRAGTETGNPSDPRAGTETGNPSGPRADKIPPYLPPLHVTPTDDLLLAYAGEGGETVRLVLVDEAGVRRFESEPLLVPEGGGGVSVPLDGATVTQGVNPEFVVGLVELLAPAEGVGPDFIPGLFSFGVQDVSSGRTRGVVTGRPLLQVMPAREPQGPPPPPGCEPNTCEPPPGSGG